MKPEPEGSGYLEKQRQWNSWEATVGFVEEPVAEFAGSSGCGIRGRTVAEFVEAAAGEFDGCCLARRVRGGVGEDEGAVLLEAVKMVGLKVGEGLHSALGQMTSTLSMRCAEPRPKCRWRSLWER